MVNAILIHRFSDNSLRNVKTDKADSLKIANYGLAFWEELREYSAEDETRQMLKTQCRLYERTLGTSVTLRNGLISLLDQTFPGINNVLHSDYRNIRGHFKWVDFVRRFWHRDCVIGLSTRSFEESYRKWCKKKDIAFVIQMRRKYIAVRKRCSYLSENESTKVLIAQAVDSLNAVYDALQILRGEMTRLASLLPEYEVVMGMQGAGEITGPMLMAEIGDVRRFTSKMRWSLLRE